jgi:hypothetical protein
MHGNLNVGLFQRKLFITTVDGPSAPSSLNFGVEPLQLHAGVFDAELPVDAALVGIGFLRPSLPDSFSKSF